MILPACDYFAIPTTLAYSDASDIIAGICFEAAFDSAQKRQIFVLRDATALIEFYDLADNSKLCRRPVRRVPFDFSGGRVLAGLWSAGIGCTARHVVQEIRRDDTTRIFQIRFQFITEGDCPYELVRPFWIAVAGAAGYTILLTEE